MAIAAERLVGAGPQSGSGSATRSTAGAGSLARGASAEGSRDDPHEARDLAAVEPRLRSTLRATLDAWVADHPLRVPPRAPADDELADTLRALGYAE